MTGWQTSLLTMTLIAACAARVLALTPAESVLEAEQQRIEVMRRAAASTVAVFDGTGQGGGSGVLISPDGFALTNFHVTAPSGPAMKCGLDDGKVYEAVIVGIDPVGDVALIQLLGRDDFPTAPLGDSDQVEVGDWVFTSGNPFLLADDFRPSIAHGMVSGVHRYQYPAGTLLEYADCIQTDAAINPGNSGGPLFNSQGELIGINGRGSFEKRGRVNVGVGYAISINQIKHFLGHLKSGRIVDHATLGATVSTESIGNVRVDEILDTSDAYRRGLRYGDQILRFAEREITTANRLKNALGIFPRGWIVPIVYQREGQYLSAKVRLTGVHDQSELYDMVQKQEAVPVKPPGDEEPSPDKEEENDKPLRVKLPTNKPKLPEGVASRYESRRGYANYWYNLQKQTQLWDGSQVLAALADTGYRWQINFQLLDGSTGSLSFDPEQAQATFPDSVTAASFQGDLIDQLSPPGSGGLLLAVHLWQRLAEKGLRKYGEVYYLGQLPRRSDGQLVDCLIGIYAGIETCFQFDIKTGEFCGLVMTAQEYQDSCEIDFSDFGEVDGKLVPRHWRVSQGDRTFAELSITGWQVNSPAEGAKN